MANVSDEVFSSTPWENVEKSIDEYAQQHPEEVEAFNREASINSSGSVYQNALNEQSYLNSFNSSQEPTNETTDAQDTPQYQETPQQEQPVDNAQQEQNVDPSLVYKDLYDRVTAPFKASGREFQVHNADEIISLMQKGVDYTKKLQALKPKLMEMRTLDDQGMLGDRLNFAIDLFNGNPQALAKLIKEKNIDVNTLVPQQNEFGEEVAPKEYVPTDYKIDPSRYEFLNAIDQLKEKGTFNKVSDALEKLDAASKAEFTKSPQNLMIMDSLVESGKFDMVYSELERARIVNNPAIAGMNDFQALDVIGQAMYNAGMFNQPAQQPQQSVENQPQYAPPYVPQQPVYNPQVAQQQEYQRQQQVVQNRKQQVAPVRNQGGKPSRSLYDPLRCSDEEFNKINIKDIMKF